MIENLLLQQVLLYTRDRSNPLHHTPSPSTTEPVWVRQEPTPLPRKKRSSQSHLVLTSSRRKTNHDDEPTLCLIESADEEKSSKLIEDILYHYNQCKDEYTRFDQNLIDLLLKRNRQRNNLSICANSGFYYRAQWLAIGLIADRFFFYIYFTATVVSYFITLWLIPFSHPNLTINIQSL